LSSDEAEARLAWRVHVFNRSGDNVREVYLDAVKGYVLAAQPIRADSLRRSLWDLRGLPSYGSETCQRWQLQPPYSSYPAELDRCPARCAPCRRDPRECALCVCASRGSPVFDPADCAATIWRYDETTGC